MNPIQTVIFIVFTWPALFIREGFDKMVEHFGHKKAWDIVLYGALIFLCLIFIILLIKKY